MMIDVIRRWMFILSIPLCLTAVTLHSVGIITLQRIDDPHAVQKCFLTQISLAEILLTVLHFALMASHTLNHHSHVPLYIDMVTRACVIPLYAGLFLLTTERFLQVYQHLKYTNSWFDKNKKNLCIFSWVCTIVTVIVMVTTHEMAFHRCKHILITVLLSLIGTMILLFEFFLTYGYLFSKVNKLLPMELRRNCCTTIRRKFLVPLLIIIMLVLFSVIPDSVRVYQYLEEINNSPDITLLYIVHFICDGCIYLFFQPCLRRKCVSLFRGHSAKDRFSTIRSKISILGRYRRKMTFLPRNSSTSSC